MRLLYQINQPYLTTRTRQRSELNQQQSESKKAALVGGPDT